MAAHAHAHVWRPGVAPDYACARFGCHAVGRWRAGKVRAVAQDAEQADLRDRKYAAMAKNALADAEGWYAGDGWEAEETPAVDELPGMGGRAMATRRGRPKRHQWDQSSDEALRDAVAVVIGDGDEPRHARLLMWHAVAGRLLPDVVVSADACRTRWSVLRERERQAEEASALARQEREDAAEAALEPRAVVEPDAWDALSARIASLEAESADDLSAALRGLRDDVRDLRGVVERLEGRVEHVAGQAARHDADAEADRSEARLLHAAVGGLRTDVVALLREWRGE